MQFLRAVSHSVGAHTATLQPHNDDSSSDDDDDNNDDSAQATTASPAPPTSTSSVPTVEACDVCLIGSRNGAAFVPCGHARFCATCIDTIVGMGTGCPICRTDIHMVMPVYN